jgi:hypothetical protein
MKAIVPADILLELPRRTSIANCLDVTDCELGFVMLLAYWHSAMAVLIQCVLTSGSPPQIREMVVPCIAIKMRHLMPWRRRLSDECARD